jgi:hypothetical protein
MSSPAGKAWEYKEVISWGIAVTGGLVGIIQRVHSGRLDLVGVLAAIGAFAFGAWLGWGCAMGLIALFDRLLKRKSSGTAMVMVSALCCIPVGIFFVHGYESAIHHHSGVLVLLGVAALVAPFLFVWHKYLSEPADPKDKPPTAGGQSGDSDASAN